MNPKEEYGYPKQTDEAWCKQIREEYELANISDEEIREEYGDGNAYVAPSLWDHCGDAAGDYQALADLFLKLEAEYEKLKASK